MQLIARLVGFCFLSLVSLPLFATPFIYTFVGNISFMSENGDFTPSILVDGVNFSMGDPIEYQLIFDFQRQGFCDDPQKRTNCNGSEIANDFDDNGALLRDRFYVEFLSATKESPLSYQDIDYNLGVDIISLGVGQVFASSAIFLESNSFVKNWQETTDFQSGTSVIGQDYWDNEGELGVDLVSGLIESTLTLDSIRPLPVPTPQTLLLFLIGGGILLFWQVRGRNTRLLSSLENQFPNTMT